MNKLYLNCTKIARFLQIMKAKMMVIHIIKMKLIGLSERVALSVTVLRKKSQLSNLADQNFPSQMNRPQKEDELILVDGKSTLKCIIWAL